MTPVQTVCLQQSQKSVYLPLGTLASHQSQTHTLQVIGWSSARDLACHPQSPVQSQLQYSANRNSHMIAMSRLEARWGNSDTQFPFTFIFLCSLVSYGDKSNALMVATLVILWSNRMLFPVTQVVIDTVRKKNRNKVGARLMTSFFYVTKEFWATRHL